MPEKSYKKKHMTSFQLIIMGFAGVILLGTVLLMLPFSSAEKVITPFHEALFTATSAVCVTGLVVKDTGSYWSLAGQTIILALIQTGGLGVVTVAASVSILSGKKISLMQRSTMQDAISAPKVGGIVRLTRFILRGTFLIEAAGTVLLLPVFMGDYGKKGIWMSVFHSISAFCNAGFDILGTDSSMFPSLTGYSGNILINLVIMLLIITGGIGFLTWDDIYTNKLNFKRYRMQSKIILMTTACLILFPAVFFYICDLTKLPMGKRLLAAAFQSVTTRTAGFNTINISEMSEASKAVMILLMLIGGSPGSTAGGMKTTTFSVLILNAIATFRSQENAGAFGRRLEYHVIKNAATIAMLYFALFFGGGIAISVYEGLPLLDCLYEAASAVGTVGLTLGITPELHVFSQVVLIILMYLPEEIREMQSSLWKKSQLDKKEKNNIMKNVLIIGLGRFGIHIAMQLNQLGHEVMAVDWKEERVDKVLSFVTNAQIGDSTNAEFLQSLGIGNYDICFVTIGESFQNSLETTSLLKELGAKLVISRAERDVQEKFLLRNGADKVVYPEKQVAKWASFRYTDDHILDYMEVDASHAIFEVEVPEEWVGKTVGGLDIRKRYNINILAVKNEEEFSIAISPETYFAENDKLLVLGEYRALQKCFRI